eukprot:3473673-Pleurochrysis_carterae.AAC.2
MLTFRAVRHCRSAVHNEASRRVRHCPFAVGIGNELRASLRLVLDALSGVLRHVGDHPVGVFVHRRGGKGQRSGEQRFNARPPTRRRINQRPHFGLVFLLKCRVHVVLLAQSDLLILTNCGVDGLS